MESYRAENLTFQYPAAVTPALDGISFSVHEGEFVTICGQSGCGKSTLLRQLKPCVSPYGARSGEIYFEGKNIADIDFREQSEKIGFVMQNPDNQIVTDKVWHELAFGLESLGIQTPEIRSRVAEMASFFGIQTWFDKSVDELSGGQKQLLNLASVIVMQPTVLILDEPTGQLEPIAAQDFLEAVSRINRELGTTIIMTEQRLEEVFAISDRIIVMDRGRIIADDKPNKTGKRLKELKNGMFDALPTAMRVFAGIGTDGECPVTVREGRKWLKNKAEETKPEKALIRNGKIDYKLCDTAISLKNVWFRYEKNLPDAVRGLSAEIGRGELYAIVGGNGTGKTTALSIIGGLNTPYRGEVTINGIPITAVNDLYDGLIGILPQNPQTLFVKKTVYLDLCDIFSDKKIPQEEREDRISEAAEVCGICELLNRHPYDLSGGEQQRAALAKILLLKPKILLLDEPTKGMDAVFKQKFAQILLELKASGVTIVMVSHDIEFCAEYADRCAMFFDGKIVSEAEPREFFAGKCFYTTAANRMARQILPEAILAEDIILAFGGKLEQKKVQNKPHNSNIEQQSDIAVQKENTSSVPGFFTGIIFAVLFVLTIAFMLNTSGEQQNILLQLLSIIFLGISISCLIPQKTLDGAVCTVQKPEKRRLTGRTLAGLAAVLLAVPLTIFAGIYFFDDRKYYFISLIIILETMLPFAMTFEGRKPQARELVIISVLCAVGVAGRAAFFMLPQFKPVAAVVIIAGVCFGAETGFLVGAVTAFVSNFFFGQGPWTPWQMFAFGIIGFAAGILFKKGLLRKTRGSLCIFGGLAVLVIYGGIMNPASVIMWQAKPDAAMFISAYAMGLPFDLIHAASTVFFLWFAAPPMIEKLDRVKVKYGIIE